MYNHAQDLQFTGTQVVNVLVFAQPKARFDGHIW
jgi:hypothetical protein